MRLYPFVLLASTAVPTRVTDASGVSGYSHTSDNSTATYPPFTDDSNDDPANQQLVAHGITNDEERAPPVKPSYDALQPLTSGIKKTIMFKLYGGISGPKLTSSGWDQVLSRDEDLLRMVGTRTAKGAIPDVDMQEFVQIATPHLRKMLSMNANRFKKRFSSQDMSPEGLAAELSNYHFFRNFSFEKVRMLQEFLGSSEKATKKFFDTLSIGFGSELEFARFLSIEKKSLVNGREAKLLQKELLTFWKKTKSEEEVLKLIDLVKQGWTYETLDTLVQFVVLRDSLESKDVDAETIKLIMDKLGDKAITQAINNGKKKGVKPVTSFFGVDDIEAEMASEENKHIDLAERLWIQLLRELDARKNGHKDVSKDDSRRPSNELDHSADLSLELSLKPPGT
ncbi:unnamed protein product [Hyaloperonospora brassicae]|uniref:RxLR effector candidate protein n=1 Tax=Hyaloperonospora brassicae TaxID=162125 RepID=A0AAV0SZF9_HYABA|nr:unnamed protein product [Hyaloperonospora brassicae]